MRLSWHHQHTKQKKRRSRKETVPALGDTCTSVKFPFRTAAHATDKQTDATLRGGPKFYFTFGPNKNKQPKGLGWQPKIQMAGAPTHVVLVSPGKKKYGSRILFDRWTKGNDEGFRKFLETEEKIKTEMSELYTSQIDKLIDDGRPPHDAVE